MLLTSELMSLALCWRLERQDGVAIGFTAHDRDLWIDHLCYRASPGMLPSKITRSDGLSADLLDVAGALTSGAIRAQDLEVGRWDGARVTVVLADWEDDDSQPLVVARGRLGEVRMEAGGFEAELRGVGAELDRPAVEQTAPECRADLGDRRCRVDMRSRTRIVAAVAVVGPAAIEVDAPDVGDEFAWGEVRWLGGRNSGLRGVIQSAEAGVLTLRDAPAFPVQVGDRLELRQGCDKAFATCVGRFGNGANFRGEPHLPGMDLLTRYSFG